MPAETAPHERTVMCWPARRELYGELMPAAEQAHAEVARTIAAYEPVTMIAAPGSGASRRRALRRCRRGRRAADRRLLVPRHRADLRPVGRTARGGSPSTGCSTRGARSSRRGTRTPPSLGAGPSTPGTRCGRCRWSSRAVRSPSTARARSSPPSSACSTRTATRTSTRADDRGTVCEPSSASTSIVWLPHGLALDDDTDGHVDNVAAFARPGVLVVQGCDDRERGRLAAMRRQPPLRASAPLDARGQRARRRRGPGAAVHRGRPAGGSRSRTSTTTSATGSSSSRSAATPPTTTWSALIAEQYPGRETSLSTSARSSPTAAAASTASPSRCRNCELSFETGPIRPIPNDKTPG